MALQTLDYLLKPITPLNPAPTSYQTGASINPSGNINPAPTPAPLGIKVTTPTPVVTSQQAKDSYTSNKVELDKTLEGMAMQNVAVATSTAQKTAAQVSQTQEANKLKVEEKKVDGENQINQTLADLKTPSQATPGQTTPVKTEGMTQDQISKMSEFDRANPDATDQERRDFLANGYKSVGSTDSAGEQAAGMTIEQKNAFYDEEYASFKTSTDMFLQGTFPLSPVEQAQITALQNTFNNLIEKQKQYNKNYEGGMTALQTLSGRSRYTPELAIGNIKNAVDDGLSKVADLESKAADAVSKLKMAFEDKNYALIEKLHNDRVKYLQEKEKTISEVNKNVKEEADNLLKSQREAFDLKRLKTEQATKDFQAILPAMPKDMAESDYQIYADSYGLDVNAVKGMIQEQRNTEKKDIMTQDSTMIGRGYRTISPTDIDRLKNDGYDVQTLNGRAYAKPQKLTSKTYKGVTTWYDEAGNKVKSEKEVGGGANPSSTGFTPSEKKKLEQAGLQNATRQEQLNYIYGKTDTLSSEEKKFDTAIKKAQANLAKGNSWGEEWNIIKGQYSDIKNEDLDVILNKEQYYNQ